MLEGGLDLLVLRLRFQLNRRHAESEFGMSNGAAGKRKEDEAEGWHAET
jgi:hypothetical protein